jgi:hypothetical protein
LALGHVGDTTVLFPHGWAGQSFPVLTSQFFLFSPGRAEHSARVKSILLLSLLTAGGVAGRTCAPYGACVPTCTADAECTAQGFKRCDTTAGACDTI